MTKIQKSIIPLNLKNEGNSVSAYLGCVSQNTYPQLRNIVDSILDKNNLPYFSTLKFEKRKKEYLTGRYMAKSVAAEYLNEPNLGEIEIENGVFNQPYVKYNGSDIPGVSLSHSNEWSVAVSFPEGHPMGVDIEKLNQQQIHVIKNQLTENEIKYIKQNNLDELEAYFLIWTMKEALSKVLKCGLTTPFSVLEIDKPSFQANWTAQCYFKNFGQYKCHSWIIDKYALSIVFPKNSDFNIDVCALFSNSKNSRVFQGGEYRIA